ncbi:type I restriction enzyme, S subunit [Methylomagnum ishizawai]|uniref:Type I restriction enzyme, S subunit n=1 Tax=Methylomagnum ishizawai TaxID=1760988 RepID=A0A1Y6D7W4_9GAMM|nr:restriction endonuclease subunit S [Methylomagnum ishizawai]SMF96552.1 type I restriction enzyme, S subunit [Methylomagnum ishizawai]
MNAEILLRHFDRIAEAPDAIPRLRRFILDLAVRGKLVAQDSEDEPAGELLKRIQAEKARLAKEGKIKKEKPVSIIKKEETPFLVPTSWKWVHLQEVASYIQRGKSPVYAVNDGFPVISQKCVQWKGLDLSVARTITKESMEKYEEARFLREDDLLWNSTGTGTIGRVVRVISPPEKLVCDSHVTVVRCVLAEAEYIRLWLCSDHVYRLIEDRAAGSTNQVELTAQMAISQIVPIPPLAEQHRIVAKVDELMALCDQLEAARNERETQRNRLVTASLNQLSLTQRREGAKKEENQLSAFAPLREPIFLANIARLATRPEHIKQLRQTILDLAVRGRLVPQDSEDEPAAELLRRIQQAKSAGYKRGDIQKPQAASPTEAQIFDIPNSWCWVSNELLCETIVDCPHSTPKFVQEGIVCLDTNSFKSGALISNKIRYVSEETYKDRTKRLTPKAKDIIFAREGIVGESVIIPDGMKCCLGQRVMLFRLMSDISPNFFQLALSSPSSLRRLLELHKGIGAKHVNVADMRNALIALPPLAEQHRIVAKVDELMNLCDQLEAQLATTATNSRRLLEAVLRDALAPAQESAAA